MQKEGILLFRKSPIIKSHAIAWTDKPSKKQNFTMYLEDDDYHVEVNVAGYPSEAIAIRLIDNIVTIAFERQPIGRGAYSTAEDIVVELPDVAIDRSSVRATLRNGLLTIIFPIHWPGSVTTIPIKK